MPNVLRPVFREAHAIEPTKVVAFQVNIHPRTRYGSDDIERVQVIAALNNGQVTSMRVFGWEDYTDRLTEGQRRELESEALWLEERKQ